MSWKKKLGVPLDVFLEGFERKDMFITFKGTIGSRYSVKNYLTKGRNNYEIYRF